MGKQSKIKKPEKLGRGQVTPIQVAFIIDRYLIDNNFIQTLSIFRSEASAFLSKSKTKEAPKSLLSLEDILNEYIRLKEQKVFVDQEKCRVEKLLQGMLEVMNAYRSSYDAPVSPQPDPASSTPEAASTYTNWTSTPVCMKSSAKVQCAVTTVPSSSKRKASASVRETTSSTKKSFMETPLCPSNVTGVRSSTKEFSHCNVLATVQHSTVCSPVQSNSENHMLHSPSVKELPSQNNICSQKRESPSPKTPSQQHSSETDLTDSPMAMSSLVESTNPSLAVTPNGPTIHSSHESDYRSNYSEYDMYQVGQESYASPSKFGTKKYIVKEHIKSRLDFDDYHMAESPVICASGASLSETNGEVRVKTDVDDFLNLSILDTDVSLSYLVSFIDAQVAGPIEQTTFDGVSNLISSVHDETGDGSMKIDGAFSLPPLSGVGILSQKDMNCKGVDDGQPSKATIACIKTDNPGRKKTKYSSDQENVPIL